MADQVAIKWFPKGLRSKITTPVASSKKQNKNDSKQMVPNIIVCECNAG